MITGDHIRLFAMREKMSRAALIDLGRSLNIRVLPEDPNNSEKEADYYLQFDEAVRQEAASMSIHYEVFYCLEKSIRKLVSDKMHSEKGASWWDTDVPDPVKTAVKGNRQRELDSAMTPRSPDPIDYTTFGELGEIVRANWAVFVDIFNSKPGFDRVMKSLNMLRGPIAHCSPLAPDEVDRLRLTVRDWFRLME